MRFKASDIGLLVRPKTITHLYLWNKDKGIDEWWKHAQFYYRWRGFEKKQQLISFYKIPLSSLFIDLPLGNPHKEPQNSYVSEVVSYIILHRGSLYHVDSKEKAETFEREIKKRFGLNAYLPVVAVGLKFYKNFSIIDFKLIAGEVWEPTNRDDAVWFYYPKDIVPLENIINFESINTGELIIMKRIDGIVLSVKELSKPQFYLANSCVSKAITLLSTNINYVRLAPEKRFKISR